MSLHSFASGVVVLSLVLGVPRAAACQHPTDRQVADQMAAYINQIWNRRPAAGVANLRFEIQKGGRPYAGAVSIQTEFNFSATQPGNEISQGFNPNSRGRWIYEELQPGTYDLEVEDLGNPGWMWRQEGVTVEAGDTPLFPIDLDKASMAPEPPPKPAPKDTTRPPGRRGAG